MDALSLTPEGPLPTDVPTLQALVRSLLVELTRERAENLQLKAQLEVQKAQLEAQKAELNTLKGELDVLKAQLAMATKHRFGLRSERKKRTPKTSEQGKPPGKRHPHGRRPLPENLERRETVYELTDEQKLCPCCKQPRTFIG